MPEASIVDKIIEELNSASEIDEYSEERDFYLIYWPEYVEDYHGWRKCDDSNPPKGSIYMNKDGKYIYLYKKEEPNRYFRYDLATNSFERVNIYKTTGTKITPVKVENLRKWFSRHKIYTDNILFAKMFLYNKSSRWLSAYKNPVRYIEAFRRPDSQAIEEWYNANVILSDIENLFSSAMRNDYAEVRVSYNRCNVRPADFDKQMLQIIKKLKVTSFHSLDTFRKFKLPVLDKYEKLYKMSQTPGYEDIFKFNTYNGEIDIFDLLNYNAELARDRIISVIDEFNLDIEALCRFLNRLRRVEGCDIEDLIDGFHYRDYLRMEKALNNGNLTKVDKYPKNWLTTFRRTKRNYDDMRQKIDEEKFKKSVQKHENLIYSDKKYSILLPEESSDIRREGASLKHCVSSYVDRVTNGTTCIVFCRENIDVAEPYVTVEVRNGNVTQAYGYQDSKPDENALKFLAKWAKKKDLSLQWRWEKDFRNNRGA